MTKLKIREKIEHAKPVSKFESICAGDMFYSPDSDILLLVIQDQLTTDLYAINLTYSEVIESEKEEYMEDFFGRMTTIYGDFYPVKKAKLSFTQGE